ncbi:MAG: hypothetical protein ABJA02_13280 [Acidobacteriota bacterium]
MSRTILPLIFALILTSAAAAQMRSADDMRRQMRDLKADRVFTLTYDKASNASKLMAVAENLPQKEAENAGAQAINFAMAFSFAGKDLTASPEKIDLTFWVLAKRPQFADAHQWIVMAGNATVDLGDARYAAKPAEKMEYLNFVVARDDLKKIAVAGAKFRLGKADFTFTPAQIKLISDMVSLSAL